MLQMRSSDRVDGPVVRCSSPASQAPSPQAPVLRPCRSDYWIPVQENGSKRLKEFGAGIFY